MILHTESLEVVNVSQDKVRSSQNSHNMQKGVSQKSKITNYIKKMRITSIFTKIMSLNVCF
jgi:hypothetical protein